MNTYSATYRAPQNVIVTTEMYEKALNIYNRHSAPLFNIKNNHYILTLSEDIP